MLEVMVLSRNEIRKRLITLLKNKIDDDWMRLQSSETSYLVDSYEMQENLQMYRNLTGYTLSETGRWYNCTTSTQSAQ